MGKISGLLLFMAFIGAPEICSAEKLVYHDIKTDRAGGLIPWYSSNLGRSFDFVVRATWKFWDTMRTDATGLPYYMNHLVWRENFDDPRGLGGDQIQMALSSWQLLYAYLGDERIKQNMKFMADHYLTHGMSPAESRLPHLPFPYNCLIYSGQYDGDMVLGPGYLQLDKSGSFGLELVHLYKLTHRDPYFKFSSERYLTSAIQIAQTLRRQIVPGDDFTSPLPFRVNAYTGELGKLFDHISYTIVGLAQYTTNWVPTMELFKELQTLDPANAKDYEDGYSVLLKWMTEHPLKTHRWGPFFEDVKEYSDTQINAVTFARFILQNKELFPQWKWQVPQIFDWVYQVLGNKSWQKYGVTVVNEQTIYPVPGQSHVARQGETELMYVKDSGETLRKSNALRQLVWATYSVDSDGKNRFPSDENWLTDGYGDYVRHYLRAMATDPSLAPEDQDHILSSTSIVQQADYQGSINKFQVPDVREKDLPKVKIFYRTYDDFGKEVIRLAKKPEGAFVKNNLGNFVPTTTEWAPLKKGGILTVRRHHGHEVMVR